MGSIEVSFKGKKMIKARNVIPAIKDKIINFPMGLGGVVPTGEKAILFMNPFYDYQIIAMGALVQVATQAVAAPFTLGYGAYTDIHGVLQPAVTNQFLTTANCLDVNGQSFSTAILPVGTMNFFKIQADTLGQGLNILRAGAPLKVSSASVSNSGTVTIFVALRPRDKDRNDFSKRPGGASDEAYGSYYR
jgi:hypothetical protein